MASSSRKCRQSLFCRIGLDDIAISKSRLEDDVSLFVELRKFSLEFIVDIERFFGGESVGMPAFASSFFDVVGIGAFELKNVFLLTTLGEMGIESRFARFDGVFAGFCEGVDAIDEPAQGKIELFDRELLRWIGVGIEFEMRATCELNGCIVGA